MNGGRFGIRNRKEVWLAVLLIIIAGIAAVLFLRGQTPVVSRAEPAKEVEKAILPETVRPAKHFKILHIMSYHLPWKWTEEQLAGFKEALGDLDVEYKVIQMDTKRHSDEAVETKGCSRGKRAYRHLEAGLGVHR